MRIEWHFYSNSGQEIMPESVSLTDPSELYGVRRADTGETIVNSGAMMVHAGNGIWYFDFTEPEPGLTYEYYVRIQESEPIKNVYYVSGHVTGEKNGYPAHTLGWCRKKLVDISGRYDLVVDAPSGDYTDAGLGNWYLNSGQQRLDNMLTYPKTIALLYKELPAGQSMVTFQSARYVTSVSEYFSTTRRRPLAWATLFIGLAPEQVDAVREPSVPPIEGETVVSNANIMLGEHYWDHAIYVRPTDHNRTIEVTAAWYSRHLTQDIDRSFWTCQHPQLLVRAAQREMEADMRNSQGVADFDATLLPSVRDIYHNLVAEEMAGTSEQWRMD